MPNKITVKASIIMSEEDKKNSNVDIPKLDSLLRAKVGAKITASLFHRLCLQNLHEILARGQLIAWPPQFLLQQSPTSKKAPARRKKKP